MFICFLTYFRQCSRLSLSEIVARSCSLSMRKPCLLLFFLIDIIEILLHIILVFERVAEHVEVWRLAPLSHAVTWRIFSLIKEIAWDGGKSLPLSIHLLYLRLHSTKGFAPTWFAYSAATIWWIWVPTLRRFNKRAWYLLLGYHLRMRSWCIGLLLRETWKLCTYSQTGLSWRFKSLINVMMGIVRLTLKLIEKLLLIHSCNGLWQRLLRILILIRVLILLELPLRVGKPCLLGLFGVIYIAFSEILKDTRYE